MTKPYRMYGADVSYFTAKARPAFRIKRLFMEELLPTPEAYRDVILPRVGMAFIPTIITPQDEAWQDTSDILDELERRHPEIPIYPATPLQRVVAYLWELYCDEFLLLPGLHYRWSFPESEHQARQDFAASNGAREQSDRLADTVKAFALGPCGINAETAPAIERHTLALFAGLEEHFAAHGYLLGERPSLADCALMGPFYAHLYRDAVPGRLIRDRAPRTCHWIHRMNQPDVDSFGPWEAGDSLAPTMRPLLELIGRDAVRLILDGARSFDDWADGHDKPGEEPPRIVTMHDTEIGGVPVERVTSAYTAWMVQRPLDAYRALTPSDRARVSAALAGTGCERLFAYEPRHRLGKSKFRLVFEKAA